jgi:hypothetical protein
LYPARILNVVAAGNGYAVGVDVILYGMMH